MTSITVKTRAVIQKTNINGACTFGIVAMPTRFLRSKALRVTCLAIIFFVGITYLFRGRIRMQLCGGRNRLSRCSMPFDVIFSLSTAPQLPVPPPP